MERGRLLLDQARLVSREVYEERIQRLKPIAEDILYSREGEVGMAALVPPGVDLCLGQRMMMFRVLSGMSPGYVMWALNSEAIFQQVMAAVAGATALHVNISDVINFHMPNPPISDQVEIATFLEEETGRLDSLSAEAEAAIILLHERRASLISAAVTGKIDVRDFVATGASVREVVAA
jgi:type I restriction enzyme S subunit